MMSIRATLLRTRQRARPWRSLDCRETFASKSTSSHCFEACCKDVPHARHRKAISCGHLNTSIEQIFAYHICPAKHLSVRGALNSVIAQPTPPAKYPTEWVLVCSYVLLRSCWLNLFLRWRASSSLIGRARSFSLERRNLGVDWSEQLPRLECRGGSLCSHERRLSQRRPWLNPGLPSSLPSRANGTKVWPGAGSNLASAARPMARIWTIRSGRLRCKP